MAKVFRLKGIPIGEDVGEVGVDIGTGSGSDTVNQWLKPSFLATLPRLSDCFDGDIMTVDLGDITNPSNFQFREVGGADIQNSASATLDTDTHGGKIVEVLVTADPANTVYTSPPIMINTVMMTAHTNDDRSIHAILPHNQISHIAINSGRWSNPSNWLNNLVPRYGSTVLISNSLNIAYDVSEENIRLDRVRVDGTLAFVTDQDTRMLVETMAVTRAGTLTIGEDNASRLPTEYSCEVTISGKYYRSGSFTPTDMHTDTIVTNRAWDRGITCLGMWRMWGAKKTTWGWSTEGLDIGDTSLTFDRDMIGLEVGQTVIIGSTEFNYVHSDIESRDLGLETEEREITSINGRTITWNDGLVYRHKNPLTGSTREDIVPPVMVKGNKNITIRSEVTDGDFWWQRGHTAAMHHHAFVDFWDVNFIGLGRTNKRVWWDGFLRSDNLVDIYEDTRYQRPLTPQSNIQSRYPVHVHLIGFGPEEDARPIISNCYVEDTPGWGMVHHDCEVDFFNNGVYKYFGAGMVSESGSELGAWTGNLSLHSTWIGEQNPWSSKVEIKNQTTLPKNIESGAGTNGIFGRYGYGFLYRGRAIRGNGNVACGAGHGHVFFNRASTNASAVIVSPLNPPRSELDLAEAGSIRNEEFALDDDVFNFVDYPILHMADNISMACVSGTYVSKQRVDQDHDVNVKVKRPKAYGVTNSGFFAEYVGTYIVDRPDTVGMLDDRANGTVSGAQSMQLMVINPRAEMPVDRGDAVNFALQNTSGRHEDFDNVEDPRYGVIGNDDPNDGGINWSSHESAIKPGPDVTIVDEDVHDTRIDYDLTPTHTLPLVMGEIDGTGIDVKNVPDSESYFKIDNLSDKGRIIFKRGKDWIFPDARNDVQSWRNSYGYWEYDAGSGTQQFARLPFIISDRLTGRPAKDVALILLSGGDITGTNNGTMIRAATGVTLANENLTYVTATNTPITFNLLTDAGPSGAGGPGTYMIDAGVGASNRGDFLAPDYGRIVKNNVTGVVTYTPDPDRIGSDECYFFIYSQNRYQTVRVNFLVNATGTAPAPSTMVEGTNFEVADHADANTIEVYLKQAPDTSERRIDLVEYSDDAGVSWRRLCHNWIRDRHKIKHPSVATTPQADTATVPAGGQSIMLRCKTDYDYVRAAASAAEAVTVT